MVNCIRVLIYFLLQKILKFWISFTMRIGKNDLFLLPKWFFYICIHLSIMDNSTWFCIVLPQVLFNSQREALLNFCFHWSTFDEEFTLCVWRSPSLLWFMSSTMWSAMNFVSVGCQGRFRNWGKMETINENPLINLVIIQPFYVWFLWFFSVEVE